jgi:leucyl/phenylalanyl-tRNA--protein transferase
MQQAYVNLHRSGYAHSVEVWEKENLVGGLYGVVVGNVFCGESMFSKAANASKTALIWLCRSGKFKMIDCQIYNEHLGSMGAEIISRSEYMKILNEEHS